MYMVPLIQNNYSWVCAGSVAGYAPGVVDCRRFASILHLGEEQGVAGDGFAGGAA